MAQLLSNPVFTALDGDALPINAAQAFFYLTGTTTAATVYQNSALSTPHAQPVLADSAGRFPTIYLDPTVTYKLVLKDAASVTIRTIDPLNDVLSSGDLTFIQLGDGAVSRTALSKLRELVSVQDFDGKFTDPTDDDAAAWQAATDAGGHITTGAGGSSKVIASSTSPFYFGNATSNLVYPGVLSDGSDLVVSGFGARIRPVSRASVAAGDIQPWFATEKNMTVGDQENLTFFGLELDTQNDADATNSNQRGPYITGVKGLRYLFTRAHSRGDRRGYFSHIQNTDNIQIVGHVNDKVTGGINLRFTKGSIVTASIFDDFSEAVDYDGASWNALGASLLFRGRGVQSNQALDLNSLERGVFTGVICEAIGNIANISYKKTTPPNFADYVGNVTPSSLTPSRDITLQGVRAKSIGNASNTAYVIGNDWGSYTAGDYTGNAHDGYDPVSNILLADQTLEDTTILLCWEARNLVLRDFHMKTVTIGSAGYAAIDLHSFTGTTGPGQFAWSDLTATLENCSVEGSQRGALRVRSPRKVRINGFRTRGNDTLATSAHDIDFLTLESRGALIEVDGLDLQGSIRFSGSATGTAWAADTAYQKNQMRTNDGGKFYRCTTSGTSASSGGPTGTGSAITDGTCTWEYEPNPFRITWGQHNKVRGDVVFGNDAHKFIFGRSVNVQAGDIAATGTVTLPVLIAERRCRVVRGSAMVGANVSADAVNYRSIVFKTIRAGSTATVASTETIAGWTANTKIDGGFGNVEAAAILEPGDLMFIESASAGTGQALTRVLIQLEVLDL